LSDDPLQDLDYCREGIIAVDYPPDIFPTSVPHPSLSAIMSKQMVLLPGEGQVNPRQLLPLLKESAQSFDAVLVNRRALAFWEEGRHVIGCFLENKDPIRADYVILAAGAGGNMFFPSKKPDLIPVRGRAFLVEAPRPLLPKVIRTQDIYLCPKPDGTLYVGATEEFMGQTGENNLLDRLWEGAIKLYPALKDQKILQIFDGVRPAHVTGVPHVRWHGEKKNLILAQGHDRNGILLSPWTVKEVMGLLDL
ncbi:MAG: FAD-dependent oxidoreductase, partial [Pseudomonadota bacterium]